MIYLLLIVFFIMLYLTFKKFDKDIIAPPVVLVAGYTLSIACAAVNVKNWGIDLHLNTFFVLLYGTLLFVITGYAVKKWMEKRASCEAAVRQKFNAISIDIKYLYVYIAFQVLVMLIWVWNIYSVTDSLGQYNSLAERMVAFRQWSSYGTDWISNYFYVFLNQFNQISMISPYLFLYIIVYNYFANKNLHNATFLFISIILSIMQILLTGGRLNVIALFLSGCLYYFLFYYKYYNRRFLIDRKFLIKLFILLICGGIGFFYAKVIVGRGDDINIGDIIPYLTMYVGGPIQLLDIFLQKPIEVSDIWGKEVFSTLNFQLIRFGILNIDPYIIHLEFRTAETGAFLGNIYTAYRSYIYDFGFIGLTILPIIFSGFVNYLYYMVIYKCKFSKVNLMFLFYSSIFWVIFFDFVRSFFFSAICSFIVIKQLIFLIILTAIFVKNFRIRDLWNNRNLEALK